MKKLFLSLAGVVMLAGFGATYAETPLDAAAMDGITAAGGQCNNGGNRGHGKGERNSQRVNQEQNGISVNALNFNNTALVAGSQWGDQNNNSGNQNSARF